MNCSDCNYHGRWLNGHKSGMKWPCSHCDNGSLFNTKQAEPNSDIARAEAAEKERDEAKRIMETGCCTQTEAGEVSDCCPIMQERDDLKPYKDMVWRLFKALTGEDFIWPELSVDERRQFVEGIPAKTEDLQRWVAALLSLAEDTPECDAEPNMGCPCARCVVAALHPKGADK